MAEQAASGWLWTPHGFVEGSVRWDDRAILAVSRRRTRDALQGIILPGLENAHTHLADAVVREELKGDLMDLVAPPGGLKHRALAKASDDEVTAAITEGLETMFRSGTTWAADFREGGLVGIRQMYRALLGHPVRGFVLGRPPEHRHDAAVVTALLRASDGIAVSAISDWPYPELEKVALDCRRANKVFALHASERVREDIDLVLDLHPRFLVHMVKADPSDLERVAAAGIPVVVCPRSNLFFGLVPDIPGLLDAGLQVLLGTDNAMVSNPSVLREMETAYKVARLKGGVPAEAVVRMATGARNAFTGTAPTGLQPGEPADLLVLAVPGDPAAAVLRSAGSDIAIVTAGGRTWRRGEPEAKAAPRAGGERRRRRPKS
jgi:cytosine/adenosine deaminase-related metal-dependent hydrolase